MLSILKYGYKATKPRVQTVNTKSLEAYRKQMHEARINAHKEAVKYLNRIEDEFLQRHKKQMKQKHFNNQCFFRAKISRNSYILHQSLEKDKSKHQQTLQRMQKFIRGQQIKRLNRDRIRKILQYESANFWLQGEEISQKFISDRVLPEYIGSTEYYHKLHSEALAYDELDFDMLHILSSNEESVKYKNKLLVPIYKEVLTIMREVKFTDEERAERDFSEAQIKLKNRYSKDDGKLKQQLQKLKEQHQQKLQTIKQNQISPETKKLYFKGKLRNLIILLKKWKQYTDILGMTSAEIHNVIQQTNNESEIAQRRKVLEKDIEKNRDKTFVNVVEEDTEDEQVSLQKFLQKKPEPIPNSGTSTESFNAQLANLLEKQQSIFNQISSELKQKEEQIIKDFQNIPNMTKNLEEKLTLEDTIKIDQGYLKPSETTASIEVLKEQFANDAQIKELLNTAGELTIDYPKLFKKVWDTQIL